MTERANSFISDRVEKNEPFYMQLSHYAAHVQNFARPETVEKYKNLPRGKKCNNDDYENENPSRNGWIMNYAGMIDDLDAGLGLLLDHLEELGIMDNTYVIFTSDNGGGHRGNDPLSGGKASIWEGGIRVPAFAVWPGVIESGQIVGDMITVHDLFTTFAKLGGAMDKIPTDRIIDGIDQTAVFLYGDGNSRRDYYHVYTGPVLAATIKQQYKRSWLGDRPGLVKNAFVDLYSDPREMRPMMAQFLWAWGPFDMMKKRHQGMIEKYPFTPTRHGIAFEGIENLRPESLQYQETVRRSMNSGK